MPCIACQLATVVYCNPFQRRYTKQIEYWLKSDVTSTDSTSDPTTLNPSTSNTAKTPVPATQDLLRLSHLSIERSYQEIKS